MRNDRMLCAGALLAGLMVLSLASAAHAADAADWTQTLRMFYGGKYAQCVEATSQAIAAGQFSENWHALQIKAQLALGRYEDADKTLAAALERYEYSLPLRWLGCTVARFNNQPERAVALAAEMEANYKQASWRYGDPASRLALGELYLSQGVDPKKVLDEVFTPIKKQQPGFLDVYLASGELALEKHDYQLAAEAFQQAARIDPYLPDSQYGLARAFAPSDDAKSAAAIAFALELNPNHAGTLLLQVDAHVDAERYAEAEKLLQKVLQTNADEPRAWAYRAVLAHLDHEPEKEKLFRAAALKWWPTNPGVDFLIGQKLSQNYRFAEGATYQRQALQFDPNYLPAKIQLAQDLLRLGKEEQGWELADEVYAKDGYNIFAHNLVMLQDAVAKFQTLESDGFQLRMDAREAEIYGPRVLALLKRAKQTLCAKYDVTLDGPVIVELFPKQQDFAIRTFGLPGGGMFLAVCFGPVITANSPASQAENPANWEATLWHEFCHVVTLHKTKNKMPRWLSEGISVYEEGLADPTWGQSLNPRFREMLLGAELTPLSELSGAFLHAKSPLHVQFAYFESALAVEFLVQNFGIDTLKKVLVDLGVGMPLNESLTRYAGSLAKLDQDFAKFAHERASALAPQVDWSEPDLPELASTDLLAAWLAEHPNNYRALQRLAGQLIAQRKWEAAKVPLEKLREIYPTDSGVGNAYSLSAKVYRELGETSQERAVLKRLAELSADDLPALARLAELAAAEKDWPQTLQYANRFLAVSPLQPQPHRYVAQAAEATGDDALAMTAYRALLALQPIDRAELHYQMSGALQRTGDLPAAKRQVLSALEEAPRYRAAHARLLAIVQQLEEHAAPSLLPAAVPAVPPAAPATEKAP